MSAHSLFGIYIHDVTPSAVAMADRILIDVWMANLQSALFFSFIFLTDLIFGY